MGVEAVEGAAGASDCDFAVQPGRNGWKPAGETQVCKGGAAERVRTSSRAILDGALTNGLLQWIL